MSSSAFTLIEVLLAVAIFSIVLVGIHMLFYGAIRLRNTTQEAIDEQVPIQQALAVMKRDLANIVMPGGTFFGEFQTSQTTSTTTNELNLLNPVYDAMQGQSGPAFYTTTGSISDDYPWGKVQRVSYSLAAPTNDAPGKVLIRSVTRNLLPSVAQMPETQPLMSGLQGLFFYFYDGLQWRDYWDSTTETNKLPLGIKVQLQLLPQPNERTAPAPIELVVPVILRAGTNTTSETSAGESESEP